MALSRVLFPQPEGPFTLSYSQYFTTLIVGGGRVKTLALVLVPYIQGGDRALASVYAAAGDEQGEPGGQPDKPLAPKAVQPLGPGGEDGDGRSQHRYRLYGTILILSAAMAGLYALLTRRLMKKLGGTV